MNCRNYIRYIIFLLYHQYAYYLLASMKSVLLQSVQRSFFHPRSMVSEVILVRICYNDLEIEEKKILKRKAVMAYTNLNTVIKKIAHPFFIDHPIVNISLNALSRPKLNFGCYLTFQITC